MKLESFFKNTFVKSLSFNSLLMLCFSLFSSKYFMVLMNCKALKISNEGCEIGQRSFDGSKVHFPIFPF